MKSTIIEILSENKERFKVPEFNRSVEFDPSVPKVQAIVGPRRAGKSSLLKLGISSLIKKGLAWDKICFLSLEDERLRTNAFEPDLILQAFRELYPDNLMLKGVYFFFDEIQNLMNWEPFINRVHEQINKHVVITGSNSKTIHTEVASVLRGRSLSIELLPLSFEEYLLFKGIPFKEHGVQRSKLISSFTSYLLRGGYPEVVLSDEKYPDSILQEYFNTILYRDILDQLQSANFNYIRYFLHRIANNTGKNMAIRKIFAELKSRGYSISLDILYKIADIAESVYLFKRISKFDPSMIKRENSDKKFYFIDNGMLNALNSSFSNNMGVLLENVVFWQLYRMYGTIYTTNIYYYKDQSHECDFILYKNERESLPVQVSFYMNTEETRNRELKGLLKACTKTNSSRGIIITFEDESKLDINGIKVNIIPAWKWCALPYDLFEL